MTRKTRARLLLFSGAAWVLLAMGPTLAQQELTFKGPPEPQAVSPLLAVDLPEYLDSYAKGSSELAKTAARFLEHYQKFIRTLDALRAGRQPLRGEHGCLNEELTAAYLAAKDTWERYHRQARVIRNQHRRLEAYQVAGYAPGLTPDLQDRLKRAVAAYERIRQEHINIQSLLRYQLDAELRRMGCDPDQMTQPPAATAATAVAASAPRTAAGAPPAPAAAAAAPPRPAATAAALAKASKEALEKADTSAEAPLIDLESESADGEAEGEAASDAAEEAVVEEIVATEDLLPPEEQEASVPQSPIGATLSAVSPAAPAGVPVSTPTPTAVSTAPAATPAAAATGMPAPTKPATTPAPSGKPPVAVEEEPPPPTPEGPADLQVRFSVDNRQCSLRTIVYLDNKRLGSVAGGKLVVFVSTEGKHTLCLSREGDPKPCSNPSDLIKVNLYDGFAVRPRC